jgi:NAD(P)-dependent dehydrogenase (short-subunit alcohol dehydrogenase family)
MGQLPPVALVTGAARRVGAALARALAEDGFAVAVHYRRSRRAAEALVREIAGGGGRAECFAADLAREEEVLALAEAVRTRLGPIGVLVNNASSFERDSVRDSPHAVFARAIATDLRAPMLLTGAVARGLPEDAEALVVNMVDARVVNPTPNYASYTAAKAALWALTQVAARDLAPRVRVVAIAPGLVLPSEDTPPERFARLVDRTPLGRPVAVADLVEGLRFALRCGSLTGAMLLLDGGWHMGWLTPRGTNDPAPPQRR